MDTTERLHFHFSLSCIGEGNGNPLQCSCLEDPRDGGAWWTAVYGVAQSRTQLKRLSSSSSIHLNVAGRGRGEKQASRKSVRAGKFLSEHLLVRDHCTGSLVLRTFFSTLTLEKEVATHASVRAWRIPGMGEPGGLLSMGLQSRTRLKRLSSSSSSSLSTFKIILFPLFLLFSPSAGINWTSTVCQELCCVCVY